MTEASIKQRMNDIAASIHSWLCDADVDELKQVIALAKSLSPINCWFATFWIKDAVIKIAEARLHDLTREKKIDHRG